MNNGVRSRIEHFTILLRNTRGYHAPLLNFSTKKNAQPPNPSGNCAFHDDVGCYTPNFFFTYSLSTAICTFE